MSCQMPSPVHCRRANAVCCVSVLQGTVCPEGDACSYTHNVYEAWLHPER